MALDRMLTHQQKPMMRRVTTKTATPGLKELGRRMTQFPITKDEIINYLMRVSKSIESVSPEKFTHLKNSDGFKEIVQEINILRNKKKSCKQIMSLCDLTQNDLPLALRKIERDLNAERLRSQEFLSTFNVVKELDFCTPQAFPLLFAFKIADMKAQSALSEEVAVEFKTGKNDPSIVVAQEKMARGLALKKRGRK